MLVGHGVHHRVAELEIRRRRDVVQVADVELGADRLAAALELEVHGAADACRRVTCSSGSNSETSLPFTRTSTSPGCSVPSAGPPGSTSLTTSMPVSAGNALRADFFGLLGEAEAAQLVVRRVVEHHLQRAARHGLAGLDELERALHAPER